LQSLSGGSRWWWKARAGALPLLTETKQRTATPRKNPALSPADVSGNIQGMHTMLQSMLQWSCVSAAFLCLCTSPLPGSDEVELRELVDVSRLQRAGEHALRQLHLVVPDKEQPNTVTRMVEKQHVTWGAIFEKGRIHALVELKLNDSAPGMVALATWHEEKWRVDQVFDISVYRLQPLGVMTPADAVAFGTEDEDVFTTIQFAPSMAPSLMVKTNLGDRGWAYAVLYYDTATHRLSVSGLFSSKIPTLEEGYWRFTKTARSKMVLHTCSFYDVEGSRLRFRGSLFNSSGGSDVLTVKVGFPLETDGKTSRALWVFRTSEEDPSIYRIHLPDDRPDDLKAQLGQVKFLKPQSGSHVCAGYFLKKLAGLPCTLATRHHHMNNRVEVKVPEDVPDADVLVSGNAEVRRAFLGAQVP
jgi:hypothetical protein